MAANAPFQALQCYKTLGTHVLVGMGAASFWRGAWYLLDDHLYPDDKAKSAAASLALGILGMRASQGLVARAERLEQRAVTLQQALLLQAKKGGGGLLEPKKSLVWLGRIKISPDALTSWAVKLPRLGAVYSVAVSCVLVWRGTWGGWDVLYEHYHDNIVIPSTMHPRSSMMHRTVTRATDPGHATHSGLLSHGIAVGVLLTTGLMASVLAPPAAVSVIRDVAIRSTPALAATAAATTSAAAPRVAVATTTTRQLQQLSLVSNQWRMHSALSSSAVTTSAAAANHSFRKVHLLHAQQPYSSNLRRQVFSNTLTTSSKFHW
jgi:Fuseless